MHLEIIFAGIEYGGHWPWLSRSFGHLKSVVHKTAFNVALVYWSGPAKGYYTSQRALVLKYLRNVFILYGIVQWQLSLGYPFIVGYVDFSQAFARVNRNILFYNLKSSGLTGRVTEIPQWSGKMITVTALCHWLQFCLLLLKWRVVGDLGWSLWLSLVVIVVVVYCCFSRLRNSDRISKSMNKLWHYSVSCHIFYITPTNISVWLVPYSNLPTISYPVWCIPRSGSHC